MKPSEWMPGTVGISVHYTASTAAENGESCSYREAVSRFDPTAFADSLAEAGAAHCIFTLTHARQYLPLPCTPLEALLPGRTAERDLIGEIIQALAQRKIRFIAYYNHSCNGGDDPEWKDACGYSEGIRGDPDRFAQNICDIVSFIARRYGKGLSGWWFDSPYSVDHRGPHDTVSTDLGAWLFPWEKLIGAAKAGNADCAVAVNAGVGSHFQYAPRLDYCAGEAVRLDEAFGAVPAGLTDHRWITLDSPAWVYGGGTFASPRFSDDALRAFLRENRTAGRMTTFNLEIDRFGMLNPDSLRQLRRVLP